MSIILRSDYFCLKITLSLNVISILFFSSYTEKGVNAEQELFFFLQLKLEICKMKPIVTKFCVFSITQCLKAKVKTRLA